MDKKTVVATFQDDYLKFYRHYLPRMEGHGDETKALCIFHDDHAPSLSFNRQTGLYQCFGCGESGDIFTFYAKTHGMALPADFPKVLAGIAQDFGIHYGNGDKPIMKVCYDYQDENGKLAYQIERLEPKSFRIRRPDGNGGWIYKKDDIHIVSYRLPEIIKAGEILIVEGEKDADALAMMGFTATTNPFGAGKWPDHFGPYFTGKHVILIPDNDEPGRQHMHKVAANLKGHAVSIRWLELPDLPEKGDASDWLAKFQDTTAAAERLSVMIEGAAEYRDDKPAATTGFNIINAADWLQTDPPPPDQILKDTIDCGDKLAIIGSSKLRKSFFLLSLLICLATGRSFLNWIVPQKRRVLLIQFEIRDHHLHRRVKNMCQALGISPDDLGDRFQILNARGLGLAGPEGVKKIMKVAASYHSEIIAFDPLYKLQTGVENASEDMKIILNSFDRLAEETNATVAYVHHDAKGNSGDRDIRDRGAGSNVLGRDYDTCFTLTPHSQDEDAAVVEVLLRNYRRQEPFTIQWVEDDENGGYRFETAPDVAPDKKTSKSKAPLPALASYLPVAEAMLNGNEMDMGIFKSAFKEKSCLSDHRIRDFINWATSGGNPPLVTREERGRGAYKKTIRAVH